MLQYIEAISQTQPEHEQTLFLAGGITNCPDWQADVVKGLFDLNITVYNPRRSSFDTAKVDESERQIAWEYLRLRKSNKIIFWFPFETLCPISLFELGAALERGQVLAVGCHPDYKRWFDVDFQMKMLGLQPSFKDLNKLINHTKQYYKLIGCENEWK